MLFSGKNKKLTTGDIANLFQVSSQTVINWIETGKMKYDRIGKGPRKVSQDEVLKFIKEENYSIDSLDKYLYENLFNKERPEVCCFSDELKEQIDQYVKDNLEIILNKNGDELTAELYFNNLLCSSYSIDL